MIKGIPTNKGIEILNSNLQKEVQTYALLGKETPKYEHLESLISKEDLDFDEVNELIFFTQNIDVGYFDENGILTYEINLRDINSPNYMYAILLLDSQNHIIASLPTPQVVLTEGVGGLMTIKLPIKGEVNEVVFVSSDYVSRDEFEVLKKSLRPPKVDINALVEQITPLIQEKKDFLDYAHNKVDSMIIHLRHLLLKKEITDERRQRENAKIGEYQLFFRNALPNGYKPLGAILSITEYPKAYLFFKNTSTSLQEGVPNGYFRLPQAGLYAKGVGDIAQVGSLGSEGLPNITGGAYGISETFQVSGWTSGAFVKQNGHNANGTPNRTDWSHSAAFTFNASASSSVYGRSSSVEVNRNHFLEGIYVGGGGIESNHYY